MLTLALVCGILVALIWFGYPLVVGGLSLFLKREAASRGPRSRHVSVVIATVDAPSVIRRRIDDILSTDYPAELMEVVVALDVQGDVRPAVIGPVDPRVKIVDGHTPGGKAATLNAAVAASSGDILVFTDAAQRFAPDTIRKLSESLDDRSFGAVSGALQIGTDGNPQSLAERYWVLEKWLREKEADIHSTVGVTGAVYAMQRSCWQDLPAGLILDDVFGPMRLVLRGFRVGFRPDARAFDERKFAPAQEYRRKARTLTGVVQTCMWLPELLVPWRNPIWAQFVFHKLLRLATPYLLTIMLLAFAIRFITWIGDAAPTLAMGLAGAAVASATLLLLGSRRMRDGVVMAAAMQAAIVRATVNGMRGRWDVWSR